jgi:glutaminyl-tRNA synthetase
VDAEIRLYDRLFLNKNPDEGGEYIQNLNPDSCQTLSNSKLEPSLTIPDKCTYQFERNGYFIKDEKDSKQGKLVFNRAVSLRDSWAKILKHNTV